MSWTPLLTGELAERARSRARAIAQWHAEHPVASPADRVLFWAYTTAVFDEPFAVTAYDAALDELVAWTRRGAPHLGLFGGLANAGWVLCHTLEPDDTQASLAAIDEALLGVLAREPWTGAHDLIEGLVGLGVYFLERIAHGAGERARAGLLRVVTQLASTAVRSDAGATWHTPPSLLPPSLGAEYPRGFYDCGIAHGVPGMLGLLARAAVHAPPARALALDARRWLEARATDERFPARITDERPDAARTAWCYGDPGVALGLYAVQQVLGPGAIDPALLARRALERDPAAARVVDATLCHGAAGLGHLASRWFGATGDAAFADLARTWLARALALPLPDDAAFLDGSAGVGLALLAATTPTDPRWDRLLLSDLAFVEA